MAVLQAQASVFLLKRSTGSREHDVCQARLLPVQIVVQYLHISMLRFAGVNLDFFIVFSLNWDMLI